MATANAELLTIADLIERLGGIPPERIRLHPSPGTATEADVLALSELPDKRLCELVDGVLVEKAMGYAESVLTVFITSLIRNHVAAHKLGKVLGPDGMLLLNPGLVRIPDISYLSWSRFPGGRQPKNPIPALVPDLAIEVLSTSNTKKEMALKRENYFAAGVRLVWEVDPRTRTVAVYTGPKQHKLLSEGQSLDGGDVLPGFILPLEEIFAELDEQAPTA